MKVLFLDIDGVLNSLQWTLKHWRKERQCIFTDAEYVRDADDFKRSAETRREYGALSAAEALTGFHIWLLGASRHRRGGEAVT